MQKIIRFASLPACFTAAAIVFLVFLVIILPDQSAQAAIYTPDNGGFDTRFFYNPSNIPDTLEAYGEAGRQAYIRARWTFDLIWPLVYGFFTLSAIGFSLARMPYLRRDHWNGCLYLLPIAGVAADYLENSLLTILMLRFPDAVPVIAVAASGATMIKWILVVPAIGLGVILPLVLLVRLLRDRMTPR